MTQQQFWKVLKAKTIPAPLPDWYSNQEQGSQSPGVCSTVYRRDLRKSQYSVKGLSFEGTQARIHGKILNSTRRESTVSCLTLFPPWFYPSWRGREGRKKRWKYSTKVAATFSRLPTLACFLATGLQELTKESIPMFKHVATVTELISL